MSKVLRYLRIAFSVVCGIAAALQILLWVASYNNFGTTDSFVIAGGVQLTVEFYNGQTALILSTSAYPEGTFPNWLVDYPELNGNVFPGFAGFAFLHATPVGDVLTFPFWLSVLVSIAAGAAPWIRYFQWRFSLRTLLILTTAIAVVLGLFVWVIRG